MGLIKLDEYSIVGKLPYSGTDNEECDLGNYVGKIAGIGPG